MLVGKEYKIEADSLNLTLYRRGVSEKTGKEYWSSIGYFSRFGNALKALVDLEVRKTELKDFKAVCLKQDELYRLIEKIKENSPGRIEVK